MYNNVSNLIRATAKNQRSIGREKRRLFRFRRTQDMNIEKAIGIYLNWKRTHASFAPISYAQRLNSFAQFVGKDRELIDITGDDVVSYHNHLEEMGFIKGTVHKKYSRATIAYSCRIFKNFFMFWHGRRESHVNHKEILSVRFISPIKRCVTEKEFNRMNESFRPFIFEDLKKRLVINLLWDTGMRVSELCDMNISDIRDKHEVYGVRSAMVRTRKTMRYNLVAWSTETDELLNQYLGIRLCIDCKSDRLFVRGSSTTAIGITTRTIQRWIDEIAERAGLGEGISPHSFRHGKAHYMLSKHEGNIRDVSMTLRHVRPESSYHYATLNPEKYLGTLVKYIGGDKENLKAA